MADQQTEQQKLIETLETIDMYTRMRAASLSVKGLLDGQIADILLLSQDQMSAVKISPEFKKKYAEEANASIDQQINLEEGWNTLEEDALANLIEVMRFNRDPKFVLHVAMVANRAERRARVKSEQPKVIDTTKVVENNIVILNINKNYIERAGDEKMINVTARPALIPLKQGETPTPKLVDQILSPAKEKVEMSATDKQLSEIQKMAKAAGVVFDED